MKIISSRENEIIKEIKKLKDKKYRDQKKQYIVEGIKMVKEAIKENADIQKIVINVDAKDYKLSKFENILQNCEVIFVTENVFKVISDVTNPQGILAIIRNR